MDREDGRIYPGALPADIPARPTCRVADLWKSIPGIPAEAVARVDWDGDYELTVSGTSFSGDFNAHCKPPSPDTRSPRRPPQRAKSPGKTKPRR